MQNINILWKNQLDYTRDCSTWLTSRHILSFMQCVRRLARMTAMQRATRLHLAQSIAAPINWGSMVPQVAAVSRAASARIPAPGEIAVMPWRSIRVRPIWAAMPPPLHAPQLTVCAGTPCNTQPHSTSCSLTGQHDNLDEIESDCAAGQAAMPQLLHAS